MCYLTTRTTYFQVITIIGKSFILNTYVYVTLNETTRKNIFQIWSVIGLWQILIFPTIQHADGSGSGCACRMRIQFYADPCGSGSENTGKKSDQDSFPQGMLRIRIRKIMPLVADLDLDLQHNTGTVDIYSTIVCKIRLN